MTSRASGTLPERSAGVVNGSHAGATPCAWAPGAATAMDAAAAASATLLGLGIPAPSLGSGVP